MRMKSTGSLRPRLWQRQVVFRSAHLMNLLSCFQRTVCRSVSLLLAVKARAGAEECLFLGVGVCRSGRGHSGCGRFGSGGRGSGFGGVSWRRSSFSIGSRRWVSLLNSGLHGLDVLQTLVNTLAGTGEFVDVSRVRDVNQRVL